MSAAPILQVEELNAGYGDLQILHDIRLVVQPGERVLVFGPNGAGKSTLMKSIVGLVAPWKGRIFVPGEGYNWILPRTSRSAGYWLCASVKQRFSHTQRGGESGNWRHSGSRVDT